MYSVGVAMSQWQSSWTKEIINGVNKELLEMFDNDDKKVMHYLEENNLFDKGHDGLIADRSYSMLVKENNSYKSVAYITAFKKEVTAVVDALEEFVDSLIELEDEVYNQKWEYIQYLQSIITALVEKRTDMLVSKWADVDSAWMKITTPIQIGHPLEYYEDHFRKAVALEWDIRLINPKIANSNQVVPNDEVISSRKGKKIFAFSDEILQGQRAKPFLKLSKEILGQEFLTKERTFLFQEDKKWHQVYDITTLGHEFGHILWCDDETESVMNKSGNFKNIEEFKATTGGLVSFFMDKQTNEKELEEFVILDTIKRAIGLIGWMEVDEVQPYYCEGLIHLAGLFETKVLQWTQENLKLTINLAKENITLLQQWYIDTYKKLALHYLAKKDATLFLKEYAVKKENYFTATNSTIDNFVQYYFNRYKQIGQELDTTDTKENYIV